MKSDKLEALERLRHLSEGDGSGGWLTAIVIVVAVVIVLFTIASSLALPIYLVRLHLRLKEIERRLDELTRGEPTDWFADDS